MTDDLTEMDDPAVLAERTRLRRALDRTPPDEQPGLLACLARVEHELCAIWADMAERMTATLAERQRAAQVADAHPGWIVWASKPVATRASGTTDGQRRADTKRRSSRMTGASLMRR